MQAFADEQDTAIRMMSLVPDGFGVGWTTHFTPFQCSASVPLRSCPTAVQALADEQDTPYRALSLEPGGFGVGWTTHFTPFQRSASITMASGRGA